MQPVLGRGFLPEEDKTPGANPVAVISYDLWQRRFNSDRELIGKTISLNNQTFTVVGIAPKPYTGMMRGLAIDVWVPAMMKPALEGRADAAGCRPGNGNGGLWIGCGTGAFTSSNTIADEFSF